MAYQELEKKYYKENIESLKETTDNLDSQKLLEDRKAVSEEHQQGLDDWANQVKQSFTWGEAWGKPIFPSAQQPVPRQENKNSSIDGFMGILIVLVIVLILFYFFRNRLVNIFSKRIHGIILIICYILLFVVVNFDFIFNWISITTILLGILGGIRLIIGKQEETGSGDLKNMTIGILIIVIYIFLAIDEFYYLNPPIEAISKTLIIFGAIIFGIYGAWRLIESPSNESAKKRV